MLKSMSKQDKTEKKKPVHLHFTPGASGGSNFVDWEEWAHYSMLKEYGDYGKFIRRGRHFVEEAGPLPTGEAGSMELEMAKAEYLEVLKMCTRNNRAWASKHPSAYSELRSSLGDDIISLLKSKEGYDAMEDVCDPLALFVAVKAVIMAGTSGSKMLDRERCQAAFHSFQMGSLP